MKALDTAVTSLSTVVGHTKAWTKMNSPEIMLIAGIGAGIGALIMTQRATLKVAAVQRNEEATKQKIVETVAKYEEDPDSLDKPYTREDAANDMVLLKRKTALEYVKLYVGPAILEVASIGLILGSHHIMKQRQAALAASCAAIVKAYQTSTAKKLTRKCCMDLKRRQLRRLRQIQRQVRKRR